MLAGIMQGAEGSLVLPIVVSSVLALVFLAGGYRTGRRGKLIENIPTSSTAGVFIGLVELKGVIESAKPLTSHLSACSCVHFHWKVEEHWSRTVTETYRDSKGRTRTRTRRQSGWKTVASGGQTMPFYLRDQDGTLLIRPDEATLQPLSVFSRTCGMSDPLYYGKGPPGAVMHSDFRRRFSEVALPVGQTIYVMGQARERPDVVAPEIAHDPEAPMFLISVHGEQQIQSRHRLGFIGWNVGGLVAVAASLGFLARGFSADTTFYTLILVAGAVVYVQLAGIAWLWMAYNSLIDLRQRVHRAWSQVDVQLKRRHDLIPALAEVVQGLQGHEREVQVELANLRTQLSATSPGEDGPDHHGVAASIRVLAENYPELKAIDGFEALQKNLTDTEQRIALARGYFNEIATHFNTRLQTVPERFVGQLAKMKPRALLAAQDFERAPVKVEIQPVAPNPELPDHNDSTG